MNLVDTPVFSAKRIVAHVDLNSFFASVEQQANPLLRGKALGVCAYLHPKGSIIAASIEAKARGMKVGMTVSQAKAKIPDALFVENDPAKYRAVGGRVFELLGTLSDRMERYSIDEAFLDLTGWCETMDDAARMLWDARQRIKEEVGEWLDCSIGIAGTRFLAKVGSDFQKPAGLTIITPENLDHILSRLAMEDVCGIGPRTRRRLEALGYRSLLEVKHAPVANLIHAFGKRGFYLWRNLHGMEVEDVAAGEARPKSIGHSYCVPSVATREGKIEGLLAKLTDRASRRLRREELLSGAVSIAVGFRAPGFASPSGPFWQPRPGEGGHTWIRMGEPIDDVFTLIETANTLLHRLWHGESVNFLAVTLFELSEHTNQGRMEFGPRASRSSEPPLQRRKRLTEALDHVRDRHGDMSLMPGRLFRISPDDAPERIGFRKL